MFDMSYEAKYHQLVSREITPRKNNKRWGYFGYGWARYVFEMACTRNYQFKLGD